MLFLIETSQPIVAVRDVNPFLPPQLGSGRPHLLFLIVTILNHRSMHQCGKKTTLLSRSGFHRNAIISRHLKDRGYNGN